MTSKKWKKELFIWALVSPKRSEYGEEEESWYDHCKYFIINYHPNIGYNNKEKQSQYNRSIRKKQISSHLHLFLGQTCGRCKLYRSFIHSNQVIIAIGKSSRESNTNLPPFRRNPTSPMSLFTDTSGDISKVIASTW